MFSLVLSLYPLFLSCSLAFCGGLLLENLQDSSVFLTLLLETKDCESGLEFCVLTVKTWEVGLSLLSPCGPM